MSANQYKGICFICHKEVLTGRGDFQSRGSLNEKTKKLVPYTGRWLVRCRGKHVGNIPLAKLTKQL